MRRMTDYADQHDKWDYLEKGVEFADLNEASSKGYLYLLKVQDKILGCLFRPYTSRKTWGEWIFYGRGGEISVREYNFDDAVRRIVSHPFL